VRQFPNEEPFVNSEIVDGFGLNPLNRTEDVEKTLFFFILQHRQLKRKHALYLTEPKDISLIQVLKYFNQHRDEFTPSI